MSHVKYTYMYTPIHIHIWVLCTYVRTSSILCENTYTHVQTSRHSHNNTYLYINTLHFQVNIHTHVHVHAIHKNVHVLLTKLMQMHSLHGLQPEFWIPQTWIHWNTFRNGFHWQSSCECDICIESAFLCKMVHVGAGLANRRGKSDWFGVPCCDCHSKHSARWGIRLSGCVCAYVYESYVYDICVFLEDM